MNVVAIISVLIALIVGIVCVVAYSFKTVRFKKVGSQAPNFTLINQEGMPCSLQDYLGQRVALYFYPKSGTPGCTNQACQLRDNYQSLKDHNIVLLGISCDTQLTQASFAQAHQLPFPILSDFDSHVARMYGVLPTMKVGKQQAEIPIARRVTFLIDPQGVIKNIITNVDVTHHAQQIIEGFQDNNKH
jgi:peroxiredoxin Q/BCP